MKQLRTLIDKIGKDRLTILLIGGLLIMVISFPIHSADDNKKKTQNTAGKVSSDTGVQDYKATDDKSSISSAINYVSYLEKKLQEALQDIDGAGQVRVMITLSDEGGCVIEKDISYKREGKSEKNPDGTTTTETSSEDTETTVFTVDEKGNSIPLVSKQILPSVEGILIVAQGGDEEAVKSEMKRAVLSLFNLDEHKISIVKMKTENRIKE